MSMSFSFNPRSGKLFEKDSNFFCFARFLYHEIACQVMKYAIVQTNAVLRTADWGFAEMSSRAVSRLLQAWDMSFTFLIARWREFRSYANVLGPFQIF